MVQLMGNVSYSYVLIHVALYGWIKVITVIVTKNTAKYFILKPDERYRSLLS